MSNSTAAVCNCPEVINSTLELCKPCLAAYEQDFMESMGSEEVEYPEFEDDGQPTMYEEYQDLYGGDDCYDRGDDFDNYDIGYHDL